MSGFLLLGRFVLKKLNLPKLLILISGVIILCIVFTSACLLISSLALVQTAEPIAKTESEIVINTETTQPIITQLPSATFTLPPTPRQTSTNSPIPPSPTVASGFPLYPCIPPNPAQLGIVTRVVDGDTIHALVDGKDYSIRYIGIDTPENTTKVEPFGAEATQKNTELVGGKIVTLVKDVSETDKYGRLLRYVLVDNAFVNLILVKEGFANTMTYPPDVACADTFLQAERQAREAGLGLWALTLLAPTQQTQGRQTAGNCDPAYPDVCIPSPPPDLNCKDIPYRRFKVLPPDPHNFDGDHDGIGCEK